MSEPMKAIVVRQPWATLIALGIKTIETRPGPPNGPMRPDGVRGLPGCAMERGERIAIVAGAAPPKVGLRLGVDAEITFSEFVVSEGWRLLDLCNERAHPLPLGAVVCTVVVADALPIIDTTSAPMHYGNPVVCVVGSAIAVHPQLTLYSVQTGLDEVRAQLPLGDFTPGRSAWMLTDPQPCEPIPCKGRQGVFVLPGDVSGQIA